MSRPLARSSRSGYVPRKATSASAQFDFPPRAGGGQFRHGPTWRTDPRPAGTGSQDERFRRVLTNGQAQRRLRVVVQSPDPLLRESIANLLRGHPQVDVVLLAADGTELAAMAEARQCGHACCRPDAVVVDTPLTARELDVLRLLSLGRRCTQVGEQLGVSARTVENHKRRIFAKLDVHGETQAVAEALRRGLLRQPASSRPARLTARESEIINLAAAGNSVKQTARALNISVKTVESIQSHLFRKLGVNSRTGAVAAVYGREDPRPAQTLRAGAGTQPT
ncbi:response regulator transcription factor [Actinocrinis sp.]|uniref:response regulator transcription factor n=1 Tax=Actinocrinis sp. TaxID=1920516 RepID=UPI002B682D05|nr:response regulator transcription factor [Actinocrinis sp.]HXR72131.1 response regulator transcription factor [Actinocrinis sp.]